MNRRRFEVVSIEGSPTDAERATLERVVDQMLESERRARASSSWLRAGRAQGRRLGMYDYRDRFSREDAWRLSPRFPVGGREYAGLVGRGDAK